MFSRILIKQLSNKSRRITDYLEKNRAQAINMNIVKFAKQMNVHPSFITKTLKKVGYNGWKDWVTFALRDYTISISNSKYDDYIRKSLFTGITSAINSIDMVRVNLLINEIINNRYQQIVFLGNRYSYYIAQDQALRYSLINLMATAIDEKTGEVNSILKNSLVFIISISGHTSLTDKQLNYLANEKKSKLILVSGCPVRKVNPAFAFIINGSLYDNKQIIENQAPTHSRITIYSMLDMIYWKIFKKNFQKNNQYLKMLEEH